MPAAISAPQPEAVDAGARVLMNGGNAVDAAVTAALVQAIIDPQMCGIGGYALLNLHWADQPGSVGVDAPALAGGKVRADMWVDRVLGPNPDGWGYFLEGNVNEAGYTSICTPGTVKMLDALLTRWGTIGWEEAIEPAVQLAEEGFTVLPALAAKFRRPRAYPQGCTLLDYILRNPEARRIYLDEDGQPYNIGQTLRNPDYAATLRHLAEYGAEDFYHGALMERMAADLEAHGSFVTRADFRQYALRENAAVEGTYRGHRLSSAAPPHGGPTLIAILNILEGYDLAALGHNSPAYIYLVAMAMKAAFADRNRFMADPAFEDVPVEWMMSKERAAEWRDHIDAGKSIHVDAGDAEQPHTTHVSVVDGAGNCVALTHSLGASSGVITPGLGFMYNNSMINFHPLPGHPNSIAPGKGRTTGMAPTIVYQRGDETGQHPFLVLGAPGASRIITSILQVILNVIDFGMDIQEAVYAPRFDCQLSDIRCHRRIPAHVVEAVARKHPARHIPYSLGGFALVHALHIDPESGALSGAADPGADGMALVV